LQGQKKNQRSLNLSENLFGRNAFSKNYLNLGKSVVVSRQINSFCVYVNGLKSEKATVTEIERGNT